MSLPEETTLTETSKTDFSDIYTQPDPRLYYRTLASLDYQIPRQALPVIRAVMDESRLDSAKGDGRYRTALDVCCSYGVNSALLYSPLAPEQVAARYAGPELAGLSSRELATADRRHYGQGGLTVLGLDASAPAIAYATSAGLLAAGWAEDLENDEPSPDLAAGIADIGLIISTGGVGYVGRPTFEGLLKSVRRPEELWLAVFVLRVFDYTPIADLLRDCGLVTEKLDATFPQRRFADDTERDAALHDVSERGLDPAGKEADGWYHAECFLTRPAAEAERTQAATLLAPAPRP
jgi:hypothetical protein